MNVTKHVWLILSMALLIATGAACNRNQPDTQTATTPQPSETPPEPRGDRRVTTAVQAKYFADENMRAHRIDVSAQNGVVTLRGSVPDEPAKQRAVTLARDVEGVKGVEDELQVRATTTAARETREIGTTGRDEVGQPGWITTKIQAQYFVNPEIKPWNIDVTTASGGVVTLEGTVDSEQDKAEAVRLARGTEGVTRVEDRLRVALDGERRTEGAERPDAWITTKIQAKYFLNRDVKGRQIDVDTNRGVVTLKGDVGTAGQKQEAEKIARETEGVRRVVNQLTVGTQGA